MITGILCMKSPRRQLKKLSQLSKTSKEKIVRNKMKRIEIIRGVR
jgi:hypothetical protein